MDAVNVPAVRQIVWMASSQVAKTEFLLNCIGYFSAQDPASILCILPTITLAETMSKDRVAPMLRDSPQLRRLYPDPKARASGSTILHKEFPGGRLTLAGSNSPASLAMRPCRVVIVDEVDRTPASTGVEGDPIWLAWKRAITYWNRLLVMTSTPTVRGESRIELAYSHSDRRVYRVACHRCGARNAIEWKDIRWQERDPATARWVCPACEHEHGPELKPKLLADGEWHARDEFKDTAGFWLNELSSPFVPWSHTVGEFLEALGNLYLIRVWTNTSMGESYEEGGEQVAKPSALYARREVYLHEVPDDVLVICTGVDVQDDRIELHSWGWAPGEESFLLRVVVLWGDPGQRTLWRRALDATREPFRGNQRTMIASAVGVDTAGHYTANAYRFCKALGDRGVALVGRAGPREIIGKPNRNNKARIPLHVCGVDACKELLASSLKHIEEPGPGYVHLPRVDWCTEELLGQLTAERKRPKMHKGVAVNEWVTVGRNEASDCWNYSLAALHKLAPAWAVLKARRRQALAELADPTPEQRAADQAPEHVPKKGRKKGRKKRGDSFVTRYRNR